MNDGIGLMHYLYMLFGVSLGFILGFLYSACHETYTKNRVRELIKEKEKEKELTKQNISLVIEKQGNASILLKNIKVEELESTILNLYYYRKSSIKEIAEMFMINEHEVQDVLNKYKLMPAVDFIKEDIANPTLKSGKI